MTAYESCHEIKEVIGDGTIGQRTCYEWFNRFKSGDTSLEDKEGRGYSVEIDVEALLEVVENDQSLTTRMLAEQFGIDHSTIVRRLKALGKVGFHFSQFIA